MNVPRSFCASVVVGHRIFVVGGCSNHGYLDSVEYLDFAAPSGNDWTIHSDLVLSAKHVVLVQGVAVGSCLVVAGGHCRTVEVLDTNRNRVWKLPPLENRLDGCSMVTVANQVTIIGGSENSTCLTLPLMDKNSWCFQRLCEQQPNGWYHQWNEMGRFRDATVATSIDRAEWKDDTCVCCLLL